MPFYNTADPHFCRMAPAAAASIKPRGVLFLPILQIQKFMQSLDGANMGWVHHL